MDQPRQPVTNGTSYEQRDPRALSHLLADHATALLVITLSLWVALTGLAHIALTLAVSFSRRLGRAPGHIAQRFSNLIENLLGSILLSLA
jgi:uncharacterized membrane protein